MGGVEGILFEFPVPSGTRFSRFSPFPVQSGSVQPVPVPFGSFLKVLSLLREQPGPGDCPALLQAQAMVAEMFHYI